MQSLLIKKKKLSANNNKNFNILKQKIIKNNKNYLSKPKNYVKIISKKL